MTDKIATLNAKSRFAGHYLLQNATVIRAANIVEDVSAGVNRIKLDDFVNMLSLLEATVASHRMFYDATTGGRVEAELKDSERILESHLTHPEATNLLNPAEIMGLDAKLELSISSIRRVSFKLDDLASKLEPPDNGGFNLDKYGKAVQSFSQDIFQAPERPDDLRAEALRILEANSYRGSKCVAAVLGIAAERMEQNQDNLINLLQERFSDSVPLKWRSRFQSALMNDIFRPTFLPALADQVCDAAFLGNERAAVATAEYNRSYINYVACRYLSDTRIASSAWKTVETACNRQEQFPWLGLMTFLSADAGSPYELLDYALSLRDQANTDVNAARTLCPWHLPFNTSTKRQIFIEEQYERLFQFGEDFQSSESHPVMVALGLPPDILSGILTVICNLSGIEVGDIPLVGDVLGMANNIAGEVPGEMGTLTDNIGAPVVDEWITQFRKSGRHDSERDLITLHSEMKGLINRALLENDKMGRDIRATCERTFGAEIIN